MLVLCFQNCSDFSLTDELIFEAAVQESVSEIDADAFPRLVETSALTRWYKSSQPDFKDDEIIGDDFAFVIAMDRTYSGEVLKLTPDIVGSGMATLSITSGKIRASRSSDTWEEYVESNLPANGEKMVVSASFGSEAGAIKLLVNGIWVQGDVVVASGTPTSFGYSSRSLGNTISMVNPSEFMVYSGNSEEVSGALNTKELNALARYVATNQTIAGVKFDPALIGGPTGPVTPGESAEFLAVKTMVDNTCLGCHGSGSAYGSLANLTEAKAISGGWIVPGNANSSKLFYRLYGSGVGAQQTMPSASGGVSAPEVQAVRDWINGL